jgi:hypothetical protein
VLEIGPHRRSVAVDDPIDHRQLMKRLIPELPLRRLAQDSVTHAGQRRGDDQGPDQARGDASDLLRNPAADVVAGDHRSPQAQLLDQTDHARRLRPHRIRATRLLRMLVGFPEAPKIGRHHIQAAQQPRDVPPVAVIARPTMQQDNGVTGSLPDVRQAEAVNGRGAQHRVLIFSEFRGSPRRRGRHRPRRRER